MKKSLGFFDLFSFASGSMISSGLFVLPAIAYAESGSASIIAYTLAALLMLPSVLTKTELATAMPKSGGTYFYVERILGTPAGIMAGFANWISIALKSSFALVGIGAFASLINPSITPFEVKLTASLFCVIFTILNLISVKSSGKFQSILVIFLLSILGLYIIFGYRFTHFENFTPFNFRDYQSILETTGLVFISFGGLTKIASIAEESKNPAKLIPKAMFSAFYIVSTLYVLVVAVTIGIMDGTVLANTLTPISDAAKQVAGQTGMVVLSIGAILAFITTANAGILSASRAPMAMSRDYLLPSIFSKTSKKFATPYFSILMTSVFMISVILFLEIELLAKVASAFMILLFIFDNLSLIVVRYSGFRNYRPSFRSPLFPFIQIFSVIVYSILIFEMGLIPISMTLVLIFLSYAWFKIFVQKTDEKNSALVQLVNKIMDKTLIKDESSLDLEEELLTILREREDIVEDRFDALVKKSLMLEFTGSYSRDEFFQKISHHISKIINEKDENIYSKLIQREENSNTNIAENLAIPHIIIEGEKRFEMVIVRCKDGIQWTKDQKPVHAVFVLLGTIDERNFHLQALMAIAQLIQEKDFMKKWLTLPTIEGLRSTILLSKRVRSK